MLRSAFASFSFAAALMASASTIATIPPFGDNVFIGSDTQLVAPVKVGDGATIGAGSTITREVPPGELALSRSPQQTRAGWQRPVKKTE